MKKIAAGMLVLSLFIMPMVNAQDYEWGRKAGDAFVYWLDRLESSVIQGGIDIAPLMTDANRTTIIVFKSINESKVEYFQIQQTRVNDTTTANDLQKLTVNLNQSFSYEIRKGTVAGQSFLLPNGSTPYLLPFSTPDYSDYFSYLESITDLMGGLIGGIVQTTLNFTVNDLTISSETTGNEFLLNAKAGLTSINLANLLNASTLTTVGINTTSLTNTTLGISINYNLTDGGLDSIRFQFNSTLDNQTISPSFLDLDMLIKRTQTLVFELGNSLSQNLIFYSITGIFLVLIALPIILRYLRR